MRRSVVSFAAAVLLMAGFVAVLGPDRLAGQLAGADPALFAVGLVAVVLAVACWSEATRRLFVATAVPLSGRRSFLAYGAGAFGKQVLPMGNAGGPAVMAYAFDREVEGEYSHSLGVVVVAEFLSLVASLLLATVGIAVLVVFGAPARDVQLIAVAVLAVAGVVAAMGTVVWYRRRAVERVLTGAAQVVAPAIARVSPGHAAGLAPERIGAGVGRYYETIDAVVTDRRTLLSAFLLTQLGWVLFAVPLYTSALALGIRLPVALVLFAVPAAGLATIVPLPGGLGGMELALVGLLTVFTTVDLPAAGGAVVLYRLCSFWFFVLLGGACVSIASTGLGNMSATIDDQPETTPEAIPDDQIESRR